MGRGRPSSPTVLHSAGFRPLGTLFLPPPVKSPACALAVPESSGPCEQRRVLPNFLWRQTLSRRVFLATWLWSAGSEPLVTDQLELILSVLDEFKF